MKQDIFRRLYLNYLESRMKRKDTIYLQPRGSNRTGKIIKHMIIDESINLYDSLCLLDLEFHLTPPIFNDKNKSIAENLQMYNRFKIMLTIKEKMNNDN